MKTPKVSVIIPVYNVDKFIEECLESAKNQTFKDYEVIIVNDGSTDNSLKIVNEYKNQFERIKIISQVNQGLSAARNNGVLAASGEFIFFLDSDDYILPNTLELLFFSCIENNVDLSICGINMFWESGKAREILYPINKTVINSIDLCKLLLTGKAFSWVWNKMYRRSVWIENNLEFPVGRTYEDIVIAFSTLNEYKRIGVVNYPLYQYRIRKSSITGKVSPKKISDFKYLLKKSLSVAGEIITDKDFPTKSYEYLEAYKTIFGTQLMSMYSSMGETSKSVIEVLRKDGLFVSAWQVLKNKLLTLKHKVRYIYYRLKLRQNKSGSSK